jgi:DeoR/GlpR family transcriptional regulator of sugar metabolism
VSCILFIFIISPLIWNIEKNDQIGRNGYEDLVTPKIVANADDVTCLTDSSRSNKYIFHEYDRLSILSGLILNADKTEILNRFAKTYKVNYLNKEYKLVGKS